MIVDGGCYCGEIRYHAEGEPLLKAECFCSDCQHITGGNSVFLMAMPVDQFQMTKGKTKAYSRPDLEFAVSREFCPDCGTHVLTRAAGLPSAVILKVGSMDNPSLFGEPDSAHFACEAQNFHRLPNDKPVFQKWTD